MSRLVVAVFASLGMWLGGFLAALAAPLALVDLALGAFGLLSTLTLGLWIGSQPSDQTIHAAEPTLSRAPGSAATPTSSRR